jgi:hypothetical protein
VVVQGAPPTADGLPTTTLWFAFLGGITVSNSNNITFQARCWAIHVGERFHREPRGHACARVGQDIAVDFNGTYAQGAVTAWDAGQALWFVADFTTLLMLPDAPFFQAPYNSSIKVSAALSCNVTKTVPLN